MFELSVAYPLDPGAKLPNWFLIDIEKILFEAWLLNPPRLPGDTLPGEIFHEVSQNPKYSSSIELTQHTQISWGTTADWPLTQFECAPRWIDELQAYIDVVQIGTNEDACSVRCKTRAPLHAPLVSMLQGMRLACQQQLGGTKVDFVLMAQTSPDGWFVVQFFPTVNLHHEGDAITNADLGLDWKLANLPYRAINSASAKGAMMINVRAYQEQALQGYPILVRLFDFNRYVLLRCVSQPQTQPKPACDVVAARTANPECVPSFASISHNTATTTLATHKWVRARCPTRSGRSCTRQCATTTASSARSRRCSPRPRSSASMPRS